MKLDPESAHRKFFEETRPIYEESKAYLLRLEKYEEKVVLTPINELRNSMFHLYEFVSNPANIEVDYINAKEHVYRTCFDTFSLLAFYLITKIGQPDDIYGHEVIGRIFPEYYSKIRTEMSTLFEEITAIRTIRATDQPISDKIPTNRLEVITTLTKWHKTVDSLTGSFEKVKAQLDKEKEEKEKEKAERELEKQRLQLDREKLELDKQREKEEKKKKDKVDLILKWLVPFVFFLLGVVLTYYSRKYW